MQMRAALLSMVFATLLSASSQAQNTAVPASDEFVGIFSSFCLQKFPDDGGLSSEASAKGPALTPAEVKAFLHGDPGQGWTISGQNMKYILTDEMPPFHACAVRTPSPQPLDGSPFFTAVKRYVAASGESLGSLQTRRVTTTNGVITLEVRAPVLDRAGQPTSETYMFFDSDYPAITKADGSKGTSFHDVRFVRQIYLQQS